VINKELTNLMSLQVNLIVERRWVDVLVCRGDDDGDDDGDTGFEV